MNEEKIKYIIVLILLIFVSLPLFTSSFLDYEQKKIEDENYQRLAKEELAEEVAMAKAKAEAQEKIYLLGKFDPSQMENFVAVPDEYDIGGYKMYLRKETLDAFEKMADAAKIDNVYLKIVSATRNFDYQKNLWNNKWDNFSKNIPNGLDVFKKILEYSAVPGTSRHHWGTEIDINGVNPSYFNTEEGKEEYDWLMKNAPSFGFCQTYNAIGTTRAMGYHEEKWHWSYLPLSRNFTQEYKNLITDADFKGFDGDQYVSNFDLINNYVLSINPDCL